MCNFFDAERAGLLFAMIDSAIKAALVLAAAGAATLAMRRRSAATRHLVWTSGIIGALLVPVLALMLPAWRILPDWRGAAGMIRQANVANLAELDKAVPPSRRPAPTVLAEEPVAKVFSLPAAKAADVPAAAGSAPVPTPRGSADETNSHEERTSINWSSWGLLIWAAGSIVLLLRLIAGTIRVEQFGEGPDGSMVRRWAWPSFAAKWGCRGGWNCSRASAAACPWSGACGA